jgi:hypothetical protein
MDEAWIRMNDLEAKRMLVAIAKHDRRTQGDTTALLIRDRFAQLFSQPSDAKLSDAAAGEAYGKMLDDMVNKPAVTRAV